MLHVHLTFRAETASSMIVVVDVSSSVIRDNLTVASTGRITTQIAINTALYCGITIENTSDNISYAKHDASAVEK